MMRINRGEDMPVVAVLIARETQDFVSFHGWCHHCFNVKQARLAIIMFSCHFEDYTPACFITLVSEGMPLLRAEGESRSAGAAREASFRYKPICQYDCQRLNAGCHAVTQP